MSFDDCFVHFPEIKTERLYLRRAVWKDINDLNEFLYDLEVQKYCGYYDLETGFLHDEFETPEYDYLTNIDIEYRAKRELRFAIEYLPDQKVIGEIIIYDFAMKRQAEVGYRIHKDYWGMGIATEALNAAVKLAFTHMDLKRLVLRCFTVNPGSRIVAEKAGFVQEGLIRKGLVVKVFADHYVFGYLKEDYPEAYKLTESKTYASIVK